jgi:hypothetical protein
VPVHVRGLLLDHQTFVYRSETVQDLLFSIEISQLQSPSFSQVVVEPRHGYSGDRYQSIDGSKGGSCHIGLSYASIDHMGRPEMDSGTGCSFFCAICLPMEGGVQKKEGFRGVRCGIGV